MHDFSHSSCMPCDKLPPALSKGLKWGEEAAKTCRLLKTTVLHSVSPTFIMHMLPPHTCLTFLLSDDKAESRIDFGHGDLGILDPTHELQAGPDLPKREPSQSRQEVFILS